MPKAVVLAFLFAAGCHARPVTPVFPSSEGAKADYCGMAVSALRTTIASNDVQPYGLEDVCVRRLASAAGRIFVDARVSEQRNGRPASAADCSSDRFTIRFDPARFQKAPTDGVVLLLVSQSADGAMEFNAVVEQADWPSKRPGVFGLSPCGSAFGTIRYSGTGWVATVARPTQSPDAL